MEITLAAKLEKAFEKNGWDDSDVKRAIKGTFLSDVLDALRGDMQMTNVRRVVDLSAKPKLERGDKVVKHLKQGKKLWNKLRLALMDPRDLHYSFGSFPHDYPPEMWKDLMSLDRRTMRPKYLAGQQPANICMRDFLFENQHLIPHQLKYGSKAILFWGTICHGNSCDYVPGLYWSYGEFTKYSRRVDFSRESHLVNEYDNPCVVFAPAPV